MTRKRKWTTISILLVTFVGLAYVWVGVDIMFLKVNPTTIRRGETLSIREKGFVSTSRFGPCDKLIITEMTDEHGKQLPVYDNDTYYSSLPNVEQPSMRTRLASSKGIMLDEAYQRALQWDGITPYVPDIGMCWGQRKPGAQSDFEKNIDTTEAYWTVLSSTPIGKYTLKITDPDLRTRYRTIEVTE